MRTRPFSPARASRPAAALMLALTFAVAGTSARAQDDLAVEPTQAVSILDAIRAGDAKVDVRGTGESTHVKLRVANSSARRLNIVLPPGLVAAASTGQGGFQSMGLGVPSDQLGRFGRANGTGSPDGFRSLPPSEVPSDAVDVPPGESVVLDVPAVCLNFGIPTPTARDGFTLMDVDDFTQDARARKALRSLAALGTSQGVAQAVAWNVFNGLSFAQMNKQARNHLNPYDISVAARFVQALDASGSHETVDPAYFRDGRVLVRVRGEGSLGKVAARLASEIQGASIFGMPVQVIDEVDENTSRPSTVLLDVALRGEEPGLISGKVLVRHHAAVGGWARLGVVDLGRGLPADQVDGPALAEGIDRAVASSFVTATPARRTAEWTTFKLSNRLPFTVDAVVMRAGRNPEAPRVSVDGLGVGPFRSTFAPAEVQVGVVERVIWNGL